MEKSKKENISIGKISELLKNAPTDDGTFYGCLYDLYVFISLSFSSIPFNFVDLSFNR